MRFPVKITSSYIWVAIPVEWVILHWYACGADGQSSGRCTVTWLPNFLGWVVYHIFLPMVLRFARESSAKIAPPFSIPFLLALPLLVSNIASHFSVSFSLLFPLFVSNIASPFSVSFFLPFPLLVCAVSPPFYSPLLLSLALSLACLPPTFSFSVSPCLYTPNQRT